MDKNCIVLFVDDLPNGDYLVECQLCFKNLNWDGIIDCPNCGAKLKYPEGASW